MHIVIAVNPDQRRQNVGVITPKIELDRSKDSAIEMGNGRVRGAEIYAESHLTSLLFDSRT